MKRAKPKALAEKCLSIIQRVSLATQTDLSVICYTGVIKNIIKPAFSIQENIKYNLLLRKREKGEIFFHFLWIVAQFKTRLVSMFISQYMLVMQHV